MNKEKEENNNQKLDYTLKTPEERKNFVQNILNNNNNNNNNNKHSEQYLETLSDYIIFAMDKAEKKQKNILTSNRMVTVNKRETSYQGLVTKFENGEDGLYNLIHEDKNVILTPKVSITKKDLEEIKPLRDLREAIEIVKKQMDAASGKKKYLLKKQLIEMCQDQYSIKNDYKQPMYSSTVISNFIKTDLSDNISIDADGEPHNARIYLIL